MYDGHAMQDFFTGPVARRVSAALALLVALGAAGIWLARQSDSAVTGGPVVLLGIDAEDGVGSHGPVSVYSSVAASVLGQVGNGGAGALVLGGGKFPNANPALQDDVTTFWQSVDADLASTSFVYVNGAAGLTSASFSGFAMLIVVSSESEAPSGGLSDDENTALVGRAQDIADFVNNGGGLIGLTQSGFVDPYLYLGGIFAITGDTDLNYSDITPLPAGTAIGITDALDVCCWHDDFTEYPDYLSVLAIGGEGENPVALGGSQVIIGDPTTTSSSSSSSTTSAVPTTAGPSTTSTTVLPGTPTTQAPVTTTTTIRRVTPTTLRTSAPTTIGATPGRPRLTG